MKEKLRKEFKNGRLKEVKKIECQIIFKCY